MILNPVTYLREELLQDVDLVECAWVSLKVYAVIFVLQTIFNIVYLECRRQRIHRFYEKQEHVAVPKGADPLLGLFKERLLPQNANRLQYWRMEKLNEHPDASIHLWKVIALNDKALLWTTDPDNVKHILVDAFDKYTKTFYQLKDPGDEFFLEWLRDGIFAAPHGSYSPDSGKNWYFQRKHASLMFTRNNFKKKMVEDVFVRKTHILCNVIANGKADKAPNVATNTLDFQNLMFKFTMDSALELFFGVPANTLEGTMDLYASAFDKVQAEAMLYIAKELPKTFLIRIFPFPFGGPYGLFNKLIRWNSQHARNIVYWIDVMRTYSTKIIEDRKKTQQQQLQEEKKKVEEADNMLTFFLSGMDEDNLPIPELAFDEQARTNYLSDIILSLMLAARDTTATVLTWSLFELSTRPDVQEKLQREIDLRLPNLRDPTFEDVYGPNLSYLNGIIYETLRLWPPVPIDQKTAMADDVLPDGTKVKKGTVINFFIFGMGRSEKLWGKDASEYNPDRWIPFKAPESGIWPVFQLGPRRCLGEQMALLEAKVVLIMIMQRFKLTLLSGQKELVRPTNNITLSLSNSPTLDSFNLWITAEPRQQSNKI